MPKLKTNATRRIITPPPTSPSPPFGLCTNTYDKYVAQRVDEPDVTSENIESLTQNFKIQISDPVHALNPDIEMGQYFVIPVSELREMLDGSGDDPEFVHICNAVRRAPNSDGVLKTFPVAIVVPVKKTTTDGEDHYAVCKNQNSVYIESFPCPPAPGCVNTQKLTEGLFKSTTVFNDFKNLL